MRIKTRRCRYRRPPRWHYWHNTPRARQRAVADASGQFVGHAAGGESPPPDCRPDRAPPRRRCPFSGVRRGAAWWSRIISPPAFTSCSCSSAFQEWKTDRYPRAIPWEMAKFSAPSPISNTCGLFSSTRRAASTGLRKCLNPGYRASLRAVAVHYAGVQARGFDRG